MVFFTQGFKYQFSSYAHIDRTHMKIEEKIKIVYLDQNAWIDLAKIKYSPNANQEPLKAVFKASKEGTAIFPFSLIHLSELNNIYKKRWRSELISLILELSNYHTFTPYWDKLRELEIKNLVLRELNLPLINVRDYLVDKGFSQLMGATPTISSKDMSGKTS